MWWQQICYCRSGFGTLQPLENHIDVCKCWTFVMKEVSFQVLRIVAMSQLSPGRKRDPNAASLGVVYVFESQARAVTTSSKDM